MNEEENIESGSQNPKKESLEQVNGDSISRQMLESSGNGEPQTGKESSSNKNMEKIKILPLRYMIIIKENFLP